MKAIRRITVRPILPEPLRPLGRLARNLRWSWHAPTRELFAALDPDQWRAADGDPVRLLGSVPPARLARLATDGDFLRRLAAADADLTGYLQGDRWYQQQDGGALPAAVAYFSPEFGITAALPQYSGGLGVLAGDHLKAASDLGVPLIGVGLLYRHGYFRQSLSRDGWQQEHYPVLDPHELPLSPLREADGTLVHVRLALPGGRELRARVWRAQVGRVPLLLLDSCVEENGPREREVTDRLYGGGSEHRLLQEILLGMGGVRALRAYCRITGHPDPEVFHSNEGHAGFLGVERIRELAGQGLDFDAALQTVRAGTVFTTHTPVPAGIDRFDRDLVARHFGPDAELPDTDVERILRLGQESYPGGDPRLFNMAVMGLRLGQRANGVSLLHGRVSRAMFAGLWPGFDAEEVPITSVTNGVHAPTWVAPEVERTARAAGASPAGTADAEDAGTPPEYDPRCWEDASAIPDDVVWRLRRELRGRLVTEVRARLYASWRQRGAAPAELAWIDSVLDPEILTIGFARRVPSYKRLTLMLRDRERLARLLLHSERPVQIVVAGKAHPADDGGKRLVQELVRFTDDPRVRHRIVFLPDYGMGMAQRLYPGCDVWLNNPLRPLEACGTSGMKAALNGCLNLSVQDGWWAEWYEPDFGWAIPAADGAGAADRGVPGTAEPGPAYGDGLDGAGLDADRRDDLEAKALYDLLEHRVAPRFYERGPGGLPDRWIEMVRRTLSRLGPKVQASRMVREYVQRLYVPAARSHRALVPEAARALAAWKTRVHACWPRVSVDHVEVSLTTHTAELGATHTLRVRVRLGELGPDDVEVQAVTGRVDARDRLADASSFPLKPVAGPDLEDRWTYEGPLTLDRTGPFGYTVRVLPAHPLLVCGAEPGLVALPRDQGGAPDGDVGVLLR